MSDKKASPEPSMDEILASIRRILAEDDGAGALRSPSRARAGDDVLELTEALNNDGSVRHVAPAAPVTPKVETPVVSDGRRNDGSVRHVAPAAPVTPKVETPVVSDGRREPPAPRPDATSAGPEPRLVSDAASEAVAASFARLTEVGRVDETDRSLDDLVRETLRPMLQAWLDENLPGLVERLVRAEIARVVGAIRPAAP